MAILSSSVSDAPPTIKTLKSPRIPGLDGIRGLAVVVVLVYHLWPAVLPGGFLGVTIFFALSGYLITRLLIEEHERNGRITLSSFYIRRARRLLPVAVVGLGMIAVVWTLTGSMTRDLRREIGFSLLHLANWSQYLSGQRYGVSEVSSPVIHYWSLAIEEQIYLVVPVLVLVLVARRPRLLLVFGIAITVSVFLTMTADGDPLIVYYSTFTRAGEFMFGALLATVPIQNRITGQKWRALLAAVLFGLLIVAAARVPITSTALYSGGLLIAGVCAATAIWAVAGAPRYAAHLDRWPLSAIGRISYGLYVYHWPILLAVKMTGLASIFVPWVTLFLTLILAVASWRWMEAPLQRSATPILRLLAVLALVGVLTFAVASFGAARDRSIDFEAVAARFDQRMAEILKDTGLEDTGLDNTGLEDTGLAPPPGIPAEVDVTGPLTFSYFGDSRAITLGDGLLAAPPPDWRVGPSFTLLGCPLSRHGEVRSLDLGLQGSRALTTCDWLAFLEQTPRTAVDVLVIWFGTWDLVERRVPALGEQWHTIKSPVFRDYLMEEIETLISAARRTLNPELILVFSTDDLHPAHPPGRAQFLHAMWEQFIDTNDHPIQMVDLVGMIADTGEAERLLPDGIHLSFGKPDPSDNTAVEIHQRFVEPLARELLAKQRREAATAESVTD